MLYCFFVNSFQHNFDIQWAKIGIPVNLLQVGLNYQILLLSQLFKMLAFVSHYHYPFAARA